MYLSARVITEGFNIYAKHMKFDVQNCYLGAFKVILIQTVYENIVNV